MSQVTKTTYRPAVLNWGASWSPRRDRIAFVRKDVGLMTMNADGTGERTLLAETQPQSSGAWTSWSPDGKRIAFAGRIDGLFVVDVDTEAASRIVDGSKAMIASPSWSPDGSRIAYSVSSKEGGSSIVSSLPDGSGTSVLGPGNSPVWGPDGRILFSTSNAGVSVMNSDGSGAVRLLDDSTAGAAVWSPDGRRIAFARGIGGIFIMNSDGSDIRPLPGTDLYDSSPAW
jgi:TolB protein